MHVVYVNVVHWPPLCESPVVPAKHANSSLPLRDPDSVGDADTR